MDYLDFNTPMSEDEFRKMVEERTGHEFNTTMEEVIETVTAWDDDHFKEVMLSAMDDIDTFYPLVEHFRQLLYKEAVEDNETHLMDVWKNPVLKSEYVMVRYLINQLLTEDESSESMMEELDEMLMKSRIEPKTMPVWILTKIQLMRENTSEDLIDVMLDLESNLD
jgi:hypothetical protein